MNRWLWVLIGAVFGGTVADNGYALATGDWTRTKERTMAGVLGWASAAGATFYLTK